MIQLKSIKYDHIRISKVSVFTSNAKLAQIGESQTEMAGSWVQAPIGSNFLMNYLFVAIPM